MEDREWTFFDKSDWPLGVWSTEPDKRQWTDQATGLPCLIVRNETGGNLCGYVGLPPKHPLYGKSYSDRIACENRDELKMRSVIAALIEAWKDDDGQCSIDCVFDVHGGLTYAGKCCPGEGDRGICHAVEPGEEDDVWWLGFDCAHSGDVSPKWSRDYPVPGDAYRDLAYVEYECRSLAKQLADYSQEV